MVGPLTQLPVRWRTCRVILNRTNAIILPVWFTTHYQFIIRTGYPLLIEEVEIDPSEKKRESQIEKEWLRGTGWCLYQWRTLLPPCGIVFKSRSPSIPSTLLFIGYAIENDLVWLRSNNLFDLFRSSTSLIFVLEHWILYSLSAMICSR